MYYVYVFLNCLKPGKFKYGNYEFEYEPFYIGKGKGDRIKTSLNNYNNKDSKKCKNHYKRNKINKIKSLGGDIKILKIYSNIKENYALFIERYLIFRIGKSIEGKGPLVNICNGGEGVSGYKHSKETLKKISQKSKNRIVSEETRKKISISNKGRIKTSEERKKLSISHTGKKLSDETKKKLSIINSKPKPKLRSKYEVTYPDGRKVIVEYLEDFCLKNKLNYNSMTAVARGKRKSNNHLGWKCKKIN
jgi:hypothetical protein